MKYNPDNERGFNLSVSMGLVESHSTVYIVGVNRTLTTLSIPEDIWEYGGLYNLDNFGTAPIMYLSSSSTLDVGQTIIIDGLDIEGNAVTQTAITNGQNAVTLTTALWRVNEIVNRSAKGLEANGMIYLGTESNPAIGVPAAANVRSMISPTHERSLSTIYTVPKGKVAFLYHASAGIQYEGTITTATEYLTTHFETTPFNEVTKVGREITLLTAASSIYSEERLFPDSISGLTTIKLRVTDCSNDMSVWGAYQLLLVEETKFDTEYLQSIGQPGY